MLVLIVIATHLCFGGASDECGRRLVASYATGRRCILFYLILADQCSFSFKILVVLGTSATTAIFLRSLRGCALFVRPHGHEQILHNRVDVFDVLIHEEHRSRSCLLLFFWGKNARLQ